MTLLNDEWLRLYCQHCQGYMRIWLVSDELQCEKCHEPLAILIDPRISNRKALRSLKEPLP
jgi:RNase P subunit RPR2